MSTGVEVIGKDSYVVACKVTYPDGETEFIQRLWIKDEEPEKGECEPLIGWGYEGTIWEIVSVLKVHATLNPYYGGDRAYCSVVYGV